MEIEKKECPQCGILMGIDSADNTYYCIDPDCGYTEDIIEEEDDDSEEKKYHCPHCNKVIDEEDLP